MAHFYINNIKQALPNVLSKPTVIPRLGVTSCVITSHTRSISHELSAFSSILRSQSLLVRPKKDRLRCITYQTMSLTMFGSGRTVWSVRCSFQLILNIRRLMHTIMLILSFSRRLFSEFRLLFHIYRRTWKLSKPSSTQISFSVPSYSTVFTDEYQNRMFIFFALPIQELTSSLQFQSVGFNINSFIINCNFCL